MRIIKVFIIQAYDQKTETGQLINVVNLELIDNNLEQAMKRAKEIIKKDNYRLSQLIEKEII